MTATPAPVSVGSACFSAVAPIVSASEARAAGLKVRQRIVSKEKNAGDLDILIGMSAREKKKNSRILIALNKRLFRGCIGAHVHVKENPRRQDANPPAGREKIPKIPAVTPMIPRIGPSQCGPGTRRCRVVTAFLRRMNLIFLLPIFLSECLDLIRVFPGHPLLRVVRGLPRGSSLPESRQDRVNRFDDPYMKTIAE